MENVVDLSDFNDFRDSLHLLIYWHEDTHFVVFMNF